jgi:hypothetical protein
LIWNDVVSVRVSGLLNKQVGGELGISEITVKAHRGKVMQKMKADSLAECVPLGKQSAYAVPIAIRPMATAVKERLIHDFKGLTRGGRPL